MALAQHIDTHVNEIELERHVKDMYRAVALDPHGDFHFEMGRAMAERLGYLPHLLDRTPQQAIESFAGVGHYFDLLNPQPGQNIVDFGSGSGMDTFIASQYVGPTGTVTGIDMTDAQLTKARHLSAQHHVANIRYKKAYIDDTGLPAGSQDAVISNGVINLAPDKYSVFTEACRLLQRGGKLALSDIVSETPLPANISCNANLWAACIGGAMQQDDYIDAIESTGFRVITVRDNPEYHFLTNGARNAATKWGVKSITLLAVKQ